MSDGTRYLEDGNPDFPEEMPIPLIRKTLGEAAKQALSLLSEAVEAEQATLMAFQEMERQRNVALEALKLAEQTAEGALDAQAEAEQKWFSARTLLQNLRIRRGGGKLLAVESSPDGCNYVAIPFSDVVVTEP
jgi:hypothetical protein